MWQFVKFMISSTSRTHVLDLQRPAGIIFAIFAIFAFLLDQLNSISIQNLLQIMSYKVFFSSSQIVVSFLENQSKQLLNIYLFKVNNRNTRERCEIYSELTIKTLERRLWGYVVSLLLTLLLNLFLTFFKCFYCWRWTGKCLMGLKILFKLH